MNNKKESMRSGDKWYCSNCGYAWGTKEEADKCCTKES